MLKEFSNSPLGAARLTILDASNPTLNDIDYLKLVWCDLAGIIRAKAIHTSQLSKQLSRGVGISCSWQAIPSVHDIVVKDRNFLLSGEARLLPDLETLTSLSYAPQQARAMGDMYLNHAPWEYCSRHFLKRMITEMNKLDLDIQIAFENDFYLLKKENGQLTPTNQNVFAASITLDSNHEFIHEVTHTLLQQGVQPYGIYAESGPGQLCLPIQHQSALAACDQQIVFRETVQAIAIQRGLLATFLPKPLADHPSSSSPLHLSLWRNNQPLWHSAQDTFSFEDETAQHFLAGIWYHLSALMLLTVSTTNSFKRFISHDWRNTYQVMGIQNHEAAIRLIPDQNNSHIEIKSVDGTCNPYLAVGAIIAAGLDGVHQKRPLPEFFNSNPSNLNMQEMREKHIYRLPESMAKAIEAFNVDQVLQAALGPKLVQTLLAIRQYDWDYFKDKKLEQEVAILINKY